MKACLHELLEQQAQSNPDAIAIISGDERLSYRQLNTGTTALAHWLSMQDLGPDRLVGIAIERSADLIVSLIAVLKAGAAYVPLDPTWPAQRLAQVIDDTNMHLLLTQQQLVDALIIPRSVNAVCIDSEALQQSITAALKSISLPSNVADERMLAYVVYTSGSSGQPKGVLIEHRSLVNYVQEAINKFQLTANDRVLQFASITVDTAAEEIFPVLLCGGTLVLRNDAMLVSETVFLQTCVQWDITVLDLPTAYWHRLVPVTINEQADLGSIRLIIIGGEYALADQVVAWNHYLRRSTQTVQLWNTYGPTETTIVATMADLSSYLAAAGRVPIGRPISNASVYVLDQSLQPVTAGEQGELYIGGIGLARCYLNQPQLTAQSFIPDPYTADTESDARLYKTGDIVRQRNDGQLEYIGRRDDQVKIRGFRVELGEIESALASHPTVTQAAAKLANSDSSGSDSEQHLVAFAVTTLAAETADPTLRSHLRSKLPHYMLPQQIVKLEVLPLTGSGKINRRELPQVNLAGLQHSNLGAGSDLPHSAIEQSLSQIWRTTLTSKPVNITRNDDFFALGGDSLQAIKALVAINYAFHVNLTLRDFFEHATLVDLAALLEQNQNVKPARVTALQPVTANSVSTRQGPLSYQQEGLWVYEKLQPNTPVHTVAQGFRLHGALDIAALRSAFDAIVHRHEVLRSTYIMQDDQPLQIVAAEPDASWQLECIDLRTEPQPSQTAQTLLKQAVNKPLQFPQGPLLEVLLLQLEQAEHRLFIRVHHSVLDGWSLGILLQELSLLYNAHRQQQPAPLPELPIQYIDFAAWQRQQADSALWQQQLSYWRQQLSGQSSATQLATDFPRVIKRSANGNVVQHELPSATVSAIKRLASEHQTTCFMVLFAAFQVLLFRYTGRTDLVVGSMVASRSRPELDSMIGYIANTLPLRTRINPQQTFIQLLLEVKANCVNSYDNLDIPFDYLTQQLQRDQAHRYFAIDILFIHYNVADRQLQLADLVTERFDIFADCCHGDFTLWVDEAEDGAQLIGEYDSNLFRESTIKRLLSHYEILLQDIIAHPDSSITNLQLIPESEYRLRQCWNDATVRHSPAATIHDLITAQADKLDATIALRDQRQAVSYAHLDSRSNQLAHYLQSLGIKRGAVVGVCLQPSVDLVLTLLALFKTGAAYLPLAADQPAERLQFQLKDAQASHVIAHQQQTTYLSAIAAQPLFIDQLNNELSALPTTPVQTICQSEDLAYLIYTSGSTGQPKGVMVPHRTVVNFLASMACEPGLSAQDVVLAHTPLTFDIAALELFLPLSVGASVFLAERELATDPEKLIQACAEHQVSLIQATPASWQLLVNAGWHGPKVKALCGGESLPHDLAQHLLQRAASVWNLYGPTETTVWSTCHQVTTDNCQLNLIGKPIANTQIHLFDPHLQLVPTGVPGEIYIGGCGVSNGYLNQPELNAYHFVANPISGSDQPDTLFRTGDLARYHSDGTLEYIGRYDNQIKLRGFRIELEEIEAILGRYPFVKQAAVSVKVMPITQDQRLVAYLVLNPDAPELASLHDELTRALPRHMLPQHLVPMPTLPLNSNGKVDRNALPMPSTLRLSDRQQPRTPMEKYLADIWADLLGLQVHEIGINDNFFDLGGHSLLAIQAVSQLRRELRFDLALRLVYESRNLQVLARHIDTAYHQHHASASKASFIIPLKSGTAGLPLFCICGIDLYRYLAKSLPSQRPVYAAFVDIESEFFFQDPVQGLVQFPSVEELARQYVAAIRDFNATGPCHLAGISFGGILALEIAQQLQQSDYPVGMLTLLDTIHPHDGLVVNPVGELLSNNYQRCRDLLGGVQRHLNRWLTQLGHRTAAIAGTEAAERDLEEMHSLRSRAYAQAQERYVVQAYPNDMAVFQASATQGGLGYSIKPDYGWSATVTGQLSLHRVDGDHLGILKPPSVTHLAQLLDQHLMAYDRQQEITGD